MIPLIAVATSAAALAAIPASAAGWQLALPPRPNVVWDETFYPNDGVVHLKSDMTTSCVGNKGGSSCTASGSYGAALALDGFVGSAVKIHGSASNSNASEPRPSGSFSVYENDGSGFAVPGDRTVHAGQGLLASQDGLQPKPYWASMNVYWADKVTVDSVTVTTGMYVNSPSAKKEDVTVETIPAVQATGLNPFYQLNGANWKATGSGNDSHAIGSGNAMVRVIVPQNTTYVRVRGLTGPDASPLDMAIRTREGTAKPDLAAGNETIHSHPVRDVATESVLFSLPLDPTQTSYFEIHANEGQFYLRDMSFWSSLTKGGPGAAGGIAFGAASVSSPANIAALFASLLLYTLI